MELYEAINRRRTVREWKDQPVAEETLMRILDAGLKAPSNNHLRDWEFIILRNEEEKENALQYVKTWVESNARMNPAQQGSKAKQMYDYAIPRQYTMLKDAPFVVIPLFKGSNMIWHPSAVNHLNLFASIWCVIENIFLASAAEGLGCSMRIPVGDEGPDVCKLLGVPEEYIMPCYIGIGVPCKSNEIIEQYSYSAHQKTHTGRW